MAQKADATVYHDCLQFKGHGTPLYHPGPPTCITDPTASIDRHLRDGVRIGDIGVPHPSGQFDFLFNATDPGITDVTSNFLSILNSIQERQNYLTATEPVSNHITKETNIRIGGQVEQGIVCTQLTGRLGFEFTFSESAGEGAILFLPEGAVEKRVFFPERLIDIEGAAIFALFKEAERRLGGSAQSILLVVRHINCRSWAIATTFHSSRNVGGTIEASAGPAGIMASTFKTRANLALPTTKCVQAPYPHNENQCVFFSSYCITKQSRFMALIRRSPVKVVDLESTTTLYPPKLKESAALPPHNTGTQTASTQTQQESSSAEASTSLVATIPFGEDQEIVVEDTSQTTDLWDPREVINRFLLDKFPEAEIAISSDDDVDRLLSAFKSQSGEFFHYEQFKSALLGLTKGTFYALLKSGVVSLFPIEEFHGLPSLPLCAEACLGDIDQMKEQLTGGVEAHQLDRENKNRTALSYGSEHGHVDVVTLLLTHLYNFDDPKNVALAIFPDSAGRSPLSYAAERGHSQIVVTLINALKSSGVDLNGKDESGRTPLSYAAEAGYVEVVRLLSGNFAESVHLAAANGRTPLSYAQECGHREVVELLKALPATVSPAHVASSPSVSYTSPATPSQQPLNRMQLDAHLVAPPNQSYTSSASRGSLGDGYYRMQLNNYYSIPISENRIDYTYSQGGEIYKPYWEAFVSVNGTRTAVGSGSSKIEAGEDAAYRALVLLGLIRI